MQRPLRRALRRSVAAFLVSATTFSLVPPPASAAGLVPAFNPLASATIIAAGQSVRHFRDEDFVKPPLGAMTFTPFDITDPTTQKPVDADTTITAPSGKRVRAGDYWKKMNQVEQDLNARGQSLRNGTKFDLGTLKGGTQAELVATHTGGHPQIKGQYDLTTGADELHQKLKHATKPVSKPDDDNSSLAAALGSAFLNAFEEQARSKEYGYKSLGLKPIAPPPAPPAPAPVAKTVGYNDQFGSQNLAAVVLNSSVTTEVGRGHVGHVLANEGVTAYLLGQSASIVSETGDGNPKAATMDFSALGDSLANFSGPVGEFDQTVVATEKNLNIFDFSFDVSCSIFTVTVAVSADLVYGAEGSAGSDYYDHSQANIGMTSDVGLVAHFTLGIGVGDSSDGYGLGASLDLDAYLTVANFAFPVIGKAAATLKMYRSGTQKTDKNIYACSLIFHASEQSALYYTFLAGNVDVRLTGCFIKCFTVFTLHIMDWPGFTGKDTLFDQSTPNKGLPASPIYSDLSDYGIPDPGTAYSKDDASGMPQACDDLRKDQQQYGYSS